MIAIDKITFCVGDPRNSTIHEIALKTGIKEKTIRNTLKAHGLKHAKGVRGSNKRRYSEKNIFLSDISKYHGFTLPIKNQKVFFDRVKKMILKRAGINVSNKDLANILNVSISTIESWQAPLDSSYRRTMSQHAQISLIFLVNYRLNKLRSTLSMRKN